MTTPILQLLNVESNYGPVQALRGVSLSVTEGKIVTVLGANGAGKTTTLKTISGIIEPLKGQVKFRGEDIQGNSPDTIVRGGISARRKRVVHVFPTALLHLGQAGLSVRIGGLNRD